MKADDAQSELRTVEPLLSDPITCGEDLAYNARRAMELAPRYCVNCNDHHMLVPAKRLADRPGSSGLNIDRPRVFEIIAGLVRERSGADRPIVDIVIAGSVDTGALATCAHAAWLGAGEAVSRVRFTVLDLCRTPLELCREYAARHDLMVKTEAVDLLEVAGGYPADIVFHHSLFRFLPSGAHVATLRKLAGWLKPGGRIIFSMSLKPPDYKQSDVARRSHRLDLIRQNVESGVIEIDEPREAFFARFQPYAEAAVQGKSEFDSPDAVRRLFTAAGMPLLSFEELSRVESLGGGRTIVRQRVLAVVAAADTR
jgi:hypothetical protein